jgi:ABC-type antimicrobial peptide transport system permease subunit
MNIEITKQSLISHRDGSELLGFIIYALQIFIHNSEVKKVLYSFGFSSNIMKYVIDKNGNETTFIKNNLFRKSEYDLLTNLAYTLDLEIEKDITNIQELLLNRQKKEINLQSKSTLEEYDHSTNYGIKEHILDINPITDLLKPNLLKQELCKVALLL